MRNLIPTLLLSMLFSSIQAQNFANRNLQAMVDAERAFVQMAKEQNKKEAFLFFLSDDVITSGPDGHRKGKEHIQNQQVKNDWLFWEVAYCDIAASGDFGYNSGPWEYRSDKADEKPVAFGEFNSVWKKQPDGSWKNVLDVGTTHGAPVEKIHIATTSKPLIEVNNKSGKSFEKHDLLEIEKKFLIQSEKNRNKAYQTYLSKEARIVHAGQLPITTEEGKEKFLRETIVPTNIQLTDGEVASSGDLGYVYGSAGMAITREGKLQTHKATYVRIWKKEDGKKWKIVLDVLSF